MAITVADLIANFNTNLGDSSTDRVSLLERLQHLTEGTMWLQETLGNEHQSVTKTLNYYDTANYYKVTSMMPDIVESVTLRRSKGNNFPPFTQKSGDELALEISYDSTDPSFAIERHDGDTYLVINLDSIHSAGQIVSFENLTAEGSTWAVDAVNSDATNLVIDTITYKEGNASFSFDLTVSQSANNRGTVQNVAMTPKNLSQYLNVASWLFWVYIPDPTYTTSITLFWGSSTSNYWSASATTDMNGNAFKSGWNRIKIDWLTATKTATPDSTIITYLRFDVNYSVSQANAVQYRIDDLKLCIPEQLTFYYSSWYVGKNTSGTPITAFGATTDVPFFSGQYDGYRYPVAHKAVSIAFKGLRLYDDSTDQENEGLKALMRLQKIIPKSTKAPTRTFKPQGVNFRRKRFR